MTTRMRAGLRTALMAAAATALAGGVAAQEGGGGGGPDAVERRAEARKEERRERRLEAREERRERRLEAREEGREATVGRALEREAWRTLDAALYRERYGERPPEGLAYGETRDGTEILIDITTGVVREILRDAAGVERRRGGEASPALRGEIPPGHLPPPGSCRVWHPDRPPGQQPPPGPCNMPVPRGAWLVRG